MQKKVSIKDIAKLAGVSPGTVDRVLHERGNVSSKSRKKVQQAIETLDYKPNKIASILASNKYYRFATFIPDPNEDEFWIHPDEGIKSAIEFISDYHTQVDTHYFKDAQPAYFLKKGLELLAQGYDGFLFSPSFTSEAGLLMDYCENHQIPYVQINTAVKKEHQEYISYIGQDSYGSGLLAAKLLNFGMTNGQSAFILHLEKEVYNAQHLLDKEDGFRDFFIDHTTKNIDVNTATYGDIEDKDQFTRFIEDLFQKYPNIGGLFVSTSRTNYLIPILEKSGLLGKVGVVGFDLKNSNLNFLIEEKIDFLINQNPHKQGYLGLMTLFEKVVMKKDQPKVQLLPLDVVMKENYTYYLEKKIEMTLV